MKLKNLFFSILLSVIPITVGAQTEVMAWSNIIGMRVDGKLISFESSFAVGKINGYMQFTGKERQPQPEFHRMGDKVMTQTSFDGVRWSQVVTDLSRGVANIALTVKSDTTLEQSAFFCLNFQKKDFPKAKLSVDKKVIQLKSKEKALKFTFGKRIETRLVSSKDDYMVYVTLLRNLTKGKEGTLSVKVESEDNEATSPVEIKLDTSRLGHRFAGFGGNFRLQSPNDQKVIDYNLSNIKVAFGRIEFPWRYWQPDQNRSGLQVPKQNQHSSIQAAAAMASRLKAEGMPVVLSAWFPPEWAIEGGFEKYIRKGGIMAYRLDPAKKEAIYRSIAEYLIFLKNQYGVEVDYYSFNESDIGIDILFTPEEHAAFIKEFGRYLANLGLRTKLLLGDNSDATTFSFILPALEDKETLPYIGAVSFHSWRGCDDKTLQKWATAAEQLNLPLIVGEGSTDAAAHRYPEIFGESSFAMYEIGLYIRICRICQPLTILQWQLTSDYSLLLGGDIYGTQGEMYPTQRFWNMKQLASTPANSLAVPVEVNSSDVVTAAFANVPRNEYAVHIVNNDSERNAVVSGIPASVRRMKICISDKTRKMETNEVEVVNGKVTLHLPSQSFVSLLP